MRQTVGNRNPSHTGNGIAEALSQRLPPTIGEFRRRSRRDEGVDERHGGEDERRGAPFRPTHLQRVHRLNRDPEENGEIKNGWITRAHAQWKKIGNPRRRQGSDRRSTYTDKPYHFQLHDHGRGNGQYIILSLTPRRQRTQNSDLNRRRYH